MLFLSVCKSPTQSLKYPDFFYHFLIWFVSFCIILCKLSPFMPIYAFKRRKTSRKRCVYNHCNLYLFRFTYAYMQITVHLPDFAGDKNIDFEFPNACLLGHPFYFGHQDFKKQIRTIATMAMNMLECKKGANFSIVCTYFWLA